MRRNAAPVAAAATPTGHWPVRARRIGPTTPATHDVELASRFASGDAGAIRVVYQLYGRAVFAIAYRTLGDVGLAEDATQQTFMQAWRAAATYDPTRALGAWLTTIARRAAIDVYRRERRHRHHERLSSDDPAQVTLPPSAEQIYEVLEVREALKRLPQHDRELIRLQHYEQLTHTEIAGKLALPIGTVKSRSFRAHRRLAGLLGHLRAEPDDTREVASDEPR